MDYRRCSLCKSHRMILLLLLLVVTLMVQTYLATIRSDTEPEDKNLPFSTVSGKENISQIESRMQKTDIKLYRRRWGKSSKTIALYNFNTSVLGNGLDLNQCKVNNCELMPNYSAGDANHDVPKIVMFYSDKLPTFPPRNKNQIFIFLAMKPSNFTPKISQISKSWQNRFNWTMTYRQNADISLPPHVIRHINTGIVRNPNVRYMYTSLMTGKSRNRNSIQRNYYQIVKSKRSVVAWIKQNCCKICRHHKFINELKMHLPLDTYDLCNFTQSQQINVIKEVVRDYKFVLILEDIPCIDYVPKLVFSLYTENIILVLEGETKYSAQLPWNTYIDINKYQSPQLLANQLNRLSTDEKTYSRRLKLKDMYEVVPSSTINQMALCEVCKRLDNVKNLRKIINNLDNLVIEMLKCTAFI